MKKVNSDELRSEYHRDDFGQGVRGKYYNDYKSVLMLQRCFLMMRL